MERSNFAPHFCDTADGGNPFRTSGKWVTTKLAIGFRITRLRPSSLAVDGARIRSTPVDRRIVPGLIRFHPFRLVRSEFCTVGNRSRPFKGTTREPQPHIWNPHLANSPFLLVFSRRNLRNDWSQKMGPHSNQPRSNYAASL